MNPVGRNGMIVIGVGATVGAGLIAFLIYRELNRRRRLVWTGSGAPVVSSGTVTGSALNTPVTRTLNQQEAAVLLGAGVECLSSEQHAELRNGLDEVLQCVSGLRTEVAELHGILRDIGTTIIEDVKKCVEESQRSRRRRNVYPRERTDSMSSSSIYFSASAGPASLYGEESEAGYSTANADSDYTDRETDREEERQESKDEDDEDEDEDRSCATVLTLRQEDSQAEEEEEEEEEDEIDGQGTEVITEVPSAELMSLLRQSDTLHEGDYGKKAEGFQLLHSNKPLYGNSAEFLWRLARAYSDMYESTENKEEKRAYAEQGRIEAESALQKNGLSAECHKWFAVLTGLNSQYESLHGKLKSSHTMKEHLDRAIALRDDDPLCFYLTGRWCYEVSTLGWLEKKAAAALFETPPTSSLHEALENFLKAEELNPGFSKTVRLYIAKCHKDLGNISEATNWAQLALRMPSAPSEENDTVALKAELQALTDRSLDTFLSSGDQ
ncbi:regulator of microtubule dynamics protein 3 [Chanos chanos]|uniref:Regulator of microtubule dynamics protein 3 n=1 Tax=Chanos chanos TaxID=29144 RepID=A0A6J2VY63_CHACN|nr:regulator of microtubule dynamics protein 3 [Chanos chanos]